MKYFQILLLLGINFSTIVLGQSIEITNNMMNPQDTYNMPIFIYNVSGLESLHLIIEYDESIILAEDVIENPVGILDGGYTFNKNLTEPGIIQLAIVSISENISNAHGMVAQITFRSIGNLGESSLLTILDAQINSDGQISRVNGSVEIIFNKIKINAVDESFIGSDDFIILGMCEGCTDGWQYGEDEFDNPNPPNDYTDIYIFHPDWLELTDSNGNTNLEYKFATDYRQQHSFNQLISWGISGSIGGDLSSDIGINISWDSDIINSTSDNFKMFLYLGSEDGIDMQEQNNITISQSELDISDNNEPNVWVKMGVCADTGETVTSYLDYDGDGLGSGITAQYCSGYEPDGWVQNADDLNDILFCESNLIDDCNVCDGFNQDMDCHGYCFGSAELDECGVCDLDNNNNNQCYDCNFEPNGGAILDNCGNCILEGENSTCEMDCTGNWGGTVKYDDCDICGGDQIDGDLDGDGDICETECTENLDCNGDCGGLATTDSCDICVGGTTGLDPCIIDCLGIPGGNAYLDECGICDSNPSNDNLPSTGVCDCIAVPDGDYELDNCGKCDNDSSNDCQLDCKGEWGGGASIDNCQICTGGSTDLMPCEKDCNGDWGGYAFMDECDVCDSDNTNNNQCFDCNNEPNGGAIIDNCNECILQGEDSTCEMDCKGEWGGSAEIDECGVCNNYDIHPEFPYGICDCSGTPHGERWLNACGQCVPVSDTSCPEDCNGVIDGLAYLDNCGNCILEEENTTCEMDCNGEWGGSASIDNCQICIGGSTGLIPCEQDCNGVWGGNYEIDLCSICDADSGNDNQCVDCNGTVDGIAELDNCGNCVEDLSTSNPECEPDCAGIWGGNHYPTFICQNHAIACNYDACFNLANNEFQLPQSFDINRIYPNPFNPQVTIDFELSEPTMIQLNIYNLNGQKVDMLNNGFTLPGNYSISWDGTNHPSGIYFVFLQNSNSVIKQKMMLVK